MRIPVAEINGEVYPEKEVAPEELPTIVIPCESEDSLKRLIDSMERAGLFDDEATFKLLNVSKGVLNKLNGWD